MKISSVPRTLATLAVAVLALVALPGAAQQADFTSFVSIGDSLTAAWSDNCLVDYTQNDSFGAILAGSAGVGYQQPLISPPGLGNPGCTYLTSLAPTFGYRPSTGQPENIALPRPYNNLGVPGFKIDDVVATNPTTLAGGLTYLILRGQATALLQAASLKPSFMLIYIGNNDVLGAATSATAIEGVTLTPMSSINPDLDTIFGTLQAAQGGTGKGIVMLIPDVATIPFVTTVSPVLGIWPAGTPNAGQPIYPLSNVGCPAGVPVCTIPPGSYLTLLAAAYLQAGVGVPCAILAPNDPKQANCNTPLPDNFSVDPNTGVITPGVVLTPPEVAAIRLRTQDINTALTAKATAAGYKVFDTAAFFADVTANGRSYGGLTVGTSYLAGGFFGYDGVHPTSLGYAIAADQLVQFVNSTYGNNLPRVNMYPFLFNGNTSSGGYPIGAALTPEEQINWAAAIFGPDTWQENLRYTFPDLNQHRAVTGNPQGTPVSIGRETPGAGTDRLH